MDDDDVFVIVIKILLANSYEEAVELFDRNSDNMLGVIADVGYFF